MRKLVPALLIATLFFFAFALLLAGPTAAQEPDAPPKKGAADAPPAQNLEPATVPPPQIERVLLAKVEPQLLKKLLTANEPIPFVVYLKAKTDTRAVAAAVLSANAQGQVETLVKRTAIINALQQTAQNSQAGVLQLLNDSAIPGGLNGQSAATTNIKPLWIVNAVAARGSLETVLALAARPEVEIIRLDKEIKLNRPITNYQLSITNYQLPQWGITKIRADLTHNALGIDGSGVVVANIDTGVDWQHPALQTKYRGYLGVGHLPQHGGNWYDATGDGANYPVDGNGHGTHTMGTMVGDGGVGVAPGARWIAVKAFNSAGVAQNSWLHEAFQWLLAPNGDPTLAPDIVNNSWSNNNGVSLEFEADAQALLDAGIYPIFSAGNNGPKMNTIGSPASLDIAFSVGATTLDDEVAIFSGRGPSPWGKIKPEVSAPGKDVVSTVPGGAYSSFDGTSMAAPHVAGLAALLLDASPDLGNNLSELSRVITSTAIPLGETTPNNDYGWGRIDAYNAVIAVVGAGMLQGAITQAGNGAPIANATIQIVPRNGGPIVSAKSAANGSYLQGLAAGKYDVTASAFGYQPLPVFNIDIITGTPTTQNFALSPTPVGTLQGTVNDKNSNAPLAATITLPGTPATTTANPNNGSYSLTLPVGTYTIRVVADKHRVGQVANVAINDGATVTENFLLAGAPSILLVDSGKWYQESQISYYQQALDDTFYTYDMWQIAKPFDAPNDVPLTSTLSTYDIVIWSAPEDSPGYVGADAALEGYLDNGGKLLLSGQDVAFFDGGGILSLGPFPYLHDYLKTNFSQDNAGTDVITGTEAGPLAGLSLTISGGDGADNQVSPDVVTITDHDFAGTLLAYNEDDLAGVHIGLCLPYRALFLSFGFEAINSHSQRSQVMEQTIDWLTQSPPAVGVELTADLEPAVGNFGSVVTHPIRIRNIGATDDSYNITFDSNWPVNPPPPANISLPLCQSQLFTPGIQIQTSAWHVADTFILTAQSNNTPAVSNSITLTSKSPAPVLLVDDDRFISFATEFQTALTSSQIAYDYWFVPKSWEGTAPPSPSLETLQMYPIVVWYTAYDWFQPLVTAEEDRLAVYLDGGGRLFFSSQDYIYNLPDNTPSPFAQDYLGVLAHTEDYSSSVVIGQMDNLISTNLGRSKLTFPFGYQNFTDALTPTNTAQIVSLGEEEQINGLMNTGLGPGGNPWRTTFLAYGPELLGETERAKLMQRAVGWLGWLGSSRTTPSQTAALAGEVIDYTAVITNDGWSDIATAYFTATFPAELTLNPASYSPELTLSNGQLLWSGPLARNERKIFNYSAKINDTVPLGTVVSQTSWLNYDTHDLRVDRLANTCVNCPDLSQSNFTVTPALGVQANDVLTYTIILRNSGLVDDPLVTTTNTLPQMLEFVTVDPPSQGNIVQEERSFTWMTPLAKNETATLTYRAVISYRTSAPIDNVADVNDNIREPFTLKARANFKVYPMRFPIIFKN